jgi:hypothetical protein
VKGFLQVLQSKRLYRVGGGYILSAWVIGASVYIAKLCMKSTFRAFSGAKPASLPTSSGQEVRCGRC